MLPRLILIADRFTDPVIAGRVGEAVRAGVRWVHLRDHAAESDAFREDASRLVEEIKRSAVGTMISVNGRLEVADELGLHYHTGVRGSTAPNRNGFKTGYSVHELEEGKRYIEVGADYLFYSPVFSTASKLEHPGVGVDQLKAFCEAMAPVPVYALGGITPERCVPCLRAGAYGVAVISGILGAEYVEGAVKAYMSSISIGDKL